MKMSSLISASFLVSTVLLSTNAYSDSNYYMTGTYRVTLSEGSSFLSCRAKPNVRAREIEKFYKGDEIEVTDVVGSSSSWLKTESGCYVRGHANYLRKIGLPQPEDEQ